jgi:flavin reductase (DIM6/NTAB) family NADH-FMN oxidoreductase RutF
MGDGERIAERFNELVGDLDYPMFIVTLRSHAGERAGCLIGFASQCSIDPPRFLICLSKQNRTYGLARGADRLAVHFVPAEAEALADLFGGETGDEVDKFARCAWHEGLGGLPILDECHNWFAGAVRERVDLGDHVGFVLEPVEAHPAGDDEEFTFHRAKRIEPGHEA